MELKRRVLERLRVGSTKVAQLPSVHGDYESEAFLTVGWNTKPPCTIRGASLLAPLRCDSIAPPSDPRLPRQ